MANSPTELYEQATELIRDSELSDYADQLAERLAFSIGFDVEDATDAEISIGGHKIGGSPDVGPDFVWPTWKGEPLTFIAQFDLTRLAPFNPEGLLPERGTLSFFSMLRPMGFEPEDALMHGAIGREAETAGAWRVVYTADNSQLRRQISPLPRSRYPVQNVIDLSPQIGLPDTSEIIAPDGVWDNEDFRGEVWEEYVALWSEIDVLSSNRRDNRLLGYAFYRQNDMREDAARFMRRKRSDMRLLAQFCSDSDHDLSFAGDGYGYFFIDKGDLEARDFSRTYFSLQR